MQHLGVNFGGIWMFELGLSGFLLRKFGLIFNLKVHWQHCAHSQLAYAMWSRYAYRAMPLFIHLNPRSCNASKQLSWFRYEHWRRQL